MKTALVNGFVIDGTIGCKAEKADVLIQDGRLMFIGDASKKSMEGYELIDCTGKYIMPGLINMHAHLFGTGKPSKILGGGGLQKAVLGFIKTAPGRKVLDSLVASSVEAELDSGVTTLRSVGDFHNSDLRIRDKVKAGKLPGPRMYCSGTAITVPGGHGDGNFAETGATPEELVRLVQQHADDGVDFIKICVTGGVMDATEKGSPGELKMSLEQTKAVCEKAHEFGLKVASHTESPAGMEVAIEGGVDTIEHGAPFDEQHAAILRERKGGVILTFTPALPLARLSPEITKLSELCVYNSEVVMEGMREGGKMAEKAGIPIGLGTDASCPFATQYNMWREVCYYHKLMEATPDKAIYAATLSNAKILGVDEITGSVEEGKFADLLVLNENPLKDLTAMREPFAVLKEGQIRYPKLKKNKEMEQELDQLYDSL
ncbi:MAG: amidohydrolase family protein [Bacillota bacterium]|nr:amidohydrolase family protein [Bacillota bacterium]